MVHEMIQFASMTVQIRDIAFRCNSAVDLRLLASFRHKKIGGKRMSLAATAIDFNRILLSA